MVEGRRREGEEGEIMKLLCMFDFTVAATFHQNLSLFRLHPAPCVRDDPSKAPQDVNGRVTSPLFPAPPSQAPAGLWETGVVGGEKGEKRKRDSLSQWERCTEYFDFRCRLLQNLKSE